jgi:DHA1 family inner membrane transport protein
VSAATLITGAATWALHVSSNGAVFLGANCIIGITWAFVMSYLLGLAAEFDRTGQMAALGGFASKMGLASGPLVDGMLLGDDNYTLIINIAAIALAFSMVASLIPARRQDRKKAASPVT